jgi:hypothetical protein
MDISVADLHYLDVDTDPAFHSAANSDPDPTFQFDADADPDPNNLMRMPIQILTLTFPPIWTLQCSKMNFKASTFSL